MKTKAESAIRRMTATELETAIRRASGDERRAVVTFLLHLAEVDRRRAYQSTFEKTSLYAYVHERLGFPECQTFLRVASARLVRKYPVLTDYLLDGRLNMTTLTELRKVLTPKRLPELLQKASGKSKKQVKELVASFNARIADYGVLRAAKGATSVPYDPSNHAAREAKSADGTVAVPVAADDGVLVLGAPSVNALTPVATNQKELALTIDGELEKCLETLADFYGLPRSDYRGIVSRAIKSEARRIDKKRGVEPDTARKPSPPIGQTLELQTLTETWAKDTRGDETASPSKAATDGGSETSLPTLTREMAVRVLGEIAKKFGRKPIPPKLARQVWHRANHCCEWRFASGARCGSRFTSFPSRRTERRSSGISGSYAPPTISKRRGSTSEVTSSIGASREVEPSRERSGTRRRPKSHPTGAEETDSPTRAFDL